ncbi:hypothetical protein [Varunaivibrio sulfuroxidans]|nr:hypothetical protein [Varunaivibrio sulfuroxidans]WES31432.1 hypothetical protein P3M64_03405 [Varunaivibrio sulfuroxidans]
MPTYAARLETRPSWKQNKGHPTGSYRYRLFFVKTGDHQNVDRRAGNINPAVDQRRDEVKNRIDALRKVENAPGSLKRRASNCSNSREG